MIRPCPYCEVESRGYELVAIEETTDETMGYVSQDGETLPTSDPITFEETMCIRFDECGHAFEKADIEAVLDELRELRGLEREARTTEDPDRLRELREFEIPAQVNAVNNRTREATRREEAEP